MSAVDKLRSFAESRCGHDEVIRDGLTYGDARELMRAYMFLDVEVGRTDESWCKLHDELEALKRAVAQHGQLLHDYHFICVCGARFDWEGGAQSVDEGRQIAIRAAKDQGWLECPDDSPLMVCSTKCLDDAAAGHEYRVASIKRYLAATKRDTCSECGSTLTLACPNCEVAG